MGLAVVSVASGGLPVVEALNGRGTPVTEAANGYGLRVTKVATYGLPVVYETIGVAAPPVVYVNWNPLDLQTTTLSNNNLTATTTSSFSGVRGVRGYNTGKLYFEATITVWGGSSTEVGVSTATAVLAGGGLVGQAVTGKALGGFNGGIFINGTYSGSQLGVRSAGQTTSVVVDLVAGLIWFRIAPVGNWNGSGTANPVTGVGGISLGVLAGSILFPIFSTNLIGDVATANFGASAFIGAVPAGFTPGWPA